MKLLHIDSSILGDGSASRAVTREVVARWQAAVADLELLHLDLAAAPLPHLTGASFAKANEGEAARDARTLADFQAADAEGLAISPENRQKGLTSALAAIPTPVALAA